jgi:hypothetical protein
MRHFFHSHPPKTGVKVIKAGFPVAENYPRVLNTRFFSKVGTGPSVIIFLPNNPAYDAHVVYIGYPNKAIHFIPHHLKVAQVRPMVCIDRPKPAQRSRTG